MKGTIGATSILNVGTKMVVDSVSTQSSFAVVFEDDGDTGYFYGLDPSREGNPILDAMHIYNVSAVTDRDQPSAVKIVWSDDGLKAALVINEYPHAVFDFEAKRGYCRTGFPPADKRWTLFDHSWDDRALQLFR